MRIQAPPNLVSRDECLALIGAGVDDWGGVSPLTPDHVNPERPWPALDELAAVTAEAGYDLVQRLTAQPQYVQAGAAWIDPRVRGARRRAGRPGDRAGAGRQPGRAALAGARRGRGVAGPHRPAHRDRHRGPAHRDPQRSRQRVRRLGVDPRPRWTSWRPARPNASTPTCWPRCARPKRDPAGCSDDEYLALATADGPALDAVAALADSLRRDVVGDDVTFVVNRNINFTNICYTGCRFCAFAQRKGDADAFSLSTDEVARPGVGGARRRRHRGVHAGRHRPRAAGHRLRRSGARGQGAGAVDARARVLPDGDRQRRHQERH